jgi:hypothetical protein
MRPIPWDAIQELVAMSDRLHRTVDLERQDRLDIRAELPGAQDEDMNVRIENGVLTLLDMYMPETEVELTVPKADTTKPKKVVIKAA